MTTSGAFTDTPVIFRTTQIMSQLSSAGVATIITPVVPAGYYRFVVRRTSRTDSTGNITLNVYDSSINLQNLLAQDTVTGNNILFFAEIKELRFPGELQIYQATGLSAGSTLYVTIFNIDILIQAYNLGVIPQG